MALLQNQNGDDGARQYNWPAREKSKVIGKSYNRLDGMEKATGAAKYTYDINLKKQLIAIGFGSPHAHCKIKNLDIREAVALPGVVDVHVLKQGEPGTEIQWEGELLAVVAAETEAAAREGVAAIKLAVEMLEVFTDDENLESAKEAKRTRKAGSKIELENEPDEEEDEDEFAEREITRLFKEATHVVEGYYGIDSITHCCLEPHGSTVEWKDGKLTAYLSTQNVSGTDEGFADGLSTDDRTVTSSDVEVICNYIGGGFGSKFAADYWGLAAARISEKTGRPVKLMLTRDQEQKIAGNRPSGYVRAKLGADKDGVIQVWDSHHWGTNGYRGGGVGHAKMPYIIRPKNFRRVATSIATNNSQGRAWRAPDHPQACALTQTLVDDLAAAMGKDSYDVFMANFLAGNAASRHPNPGETYADQLKIAGRLIDWKAKWHLHGKGKVRDGVVDGLGIGCHEWGGGANQSNTTIKVHPDGSVEIFCGTQDLGTGTRTVIAQVVAETFGLTIDDIKINIGRSSYPASGASGGSTTVGAVCESHRRASQDAIQTLFGLAAKQLRVEASDLEAVAGRIQLQSRLEPRNARRLRGQGSKTLSWKEVCGLLGLKPLEVSASYERGGGADGVAKTKGDIPGPLSDEGVCGVQVAHVEVDLETGQVRMKKFVAVQDQGLVINPKTCKSQIYGAVNMGIHAAFFEQRINDPGSGKFLNAELSDYKLARLGDVGEIVVELYETDFERSRGVIGNGEPPVIAPTTAISNAVCNALGVRVPVIPLTPKRVLEALKAAGRA